MFILVLLLAFSSGLVAAQPRPALSNASGLASRGLPEYVQTR